MGETPSVCEVEASGLQTEASQLEEVRSTNMTKANRIMNYICSFTLWVSLITPSSCSSNTNILHAQKPRSHARDSPCTELQIWIPSECCNSSLLFEDTDGPSNFWVSSLGSCTGVRNACLTCFVTLGDADERLGKYFLGYLLGLISRRPHLRF